MASVPALVARLQRVVGELSRRFPERRFTLDGHLVGSIGEVVAAHDYGLRLLLPGARRHDARTCDGRLVQIKVTQVERVALYSRPDYLLVLKLANDGSFDEVYNGPGQGPWSRSGRRQKNGQRSVGLATLRSLMRGVDQHGRLPRRRTIRPLVHGSSRGQRAR